MQINRGVKIGIVVQNIYTINESDVATNKKNLERTSHVTKICVYESHFTHNMSWGTIIKNRQIAEFSYELFLISGIL